jgi:hypothetical protein
MYGTLIQAIQLQLAKWLSKSVEKNSSSVRNSCPNSEEIPLFTETGDPITSSEKPATSPFPGENELNPYLHTLLIYDLI